MPKEGVVRVVRSNRPIGLMRSTIWWVCQISGRPRHAYNVDEVGVPSQRDKL